MDHNDKIFRVKDLESFRILEMVRKLCEKRERFHSLLIFRRKKNVYRKYNYIENTVSKMDFIILIYFVTNANINMWCGWIFFSININVVIFFFIFHQLWWPWHGSNPRSCQTKRRSNSNTTWHRDWWTEIERYFHLEQEWYI